MTWSPGLHAWRGRKRSDGSLLPSSGPTDDLFETANLYPRTTGLPVTVWVSPRGGARHDARVKVSRQRGDRMVLDDTAVVSVRPQPALIEGQVDRDILEVVTAWIDLNREVLIAYWDGEADTADLIQRLQRV